METTPFHRLHTTHFKARLSLVNLLVNGHVEGARPARIQGTCISRGLDSGSAMCMELSPIVQNFITNI